MNLDELRTRIVDAEAVSDRDRAAMVTREVAGKLLAFLWREMRVNDTLVSTPVNPDEVRASGKTIDELFAAAATNIARIKMRVDIMRVTDQCRLFFVREHGDDDPNVAGRMLALPSLRAEIARVGPPPVKALLAEPDRNGALVSVPSASLLAVFFIDGSNLQEGVVNLVGNTQANYDPDAADALSPWLYWISGDHIEEMRYQCDDDGDLADLALPDALVPLWQAG
jgi:hypothetical protein